MNAYMYVLMYALIMHVLHIYVKKLLMYTCIIVYACRAYMCMYIYYISMLNY